jgi:hypothetical protein
LQAELEDRGEVFRVAVVVDRAELMQEDDSIGGVVMSVEAKEDPFKEEAETRVGLEGKDGMEGRCLWSHFFWRQVWKKTFKKQEHSL